MSQASNTSLRYFLIVAIFSWSGLLPILGCGGGVDPLQTPESALEIDWASFELAIPVCPDGPTLEGVDVSYHQGGIAPIDWFKVANDGIQFAIIRTGDAEKDPYEDVDFAYNWQASRQAGIVRGAYHFFRPDHDALTQADEMLQVIQASGGIQADDLPPSIDLELNEGIEDMNRMEYWLHLWMERIEQGTGRIPMIYTFKDWWNAYVGSDDFEHHALWIARWATECPLLPPAWTHWDFWQYCGNNCFVDGIRAEADLDKFNGDQEALSALIDSSKIFCGDGQCSGGESPGSCPDDCPCMQVPPDGRIIDQSEACFEMGGTPENWHLENAGYEGSLLWLEANNLYNYDNFGIWHLDFEQAGKYRLEAYLEKPWAQSKQASYRIFHNEFTVEKRIDQTRVDGWVVLGDYQFATGKFQWIRLNRSTGESPSAHIQLVYDAIRLTRLDPTDEPGPDSGGELGQPDGGIDESISAEPSLEDPLREPLGEISNEPTPQGDGGQGTDEAATGADPTGPDLTPTQELGQENQPESGDTDTSSNDQGKTDWVPKEQGAIVGCGASTVTGIEAQGFGPSVWLILWVCVLRGSRRR